MRERLSNSLYRDGKSRNVISNNFNEYVSRFHVCQPHGSSVARHNLLGRKVLFRGGLERSGHPAFIRRPRRYNWPPLLSFSRIPSPKPATPSSSFLRLLLLLEMLHIAASGANVFFERHKRFIGISVRSLFRSFVKSGRSDAMLDFPSFLRLTSTPQRCRKRDNLFQLNL